MIAKPDASVTVSRYSVPVSCHSIDQGHPYSPLGDHSPEKDPEPYETDYNVVSHRKISQTLEMCPLTTASFVLDELDVSTYALDAPTHVFELPVSTIKSSGSHGQISYTNEATRCLTLRWRGPNADLRM